MTKGSGTRSGMLWEVERLLKETENLPQILLMENVTQVHGQKNILDFEEWISFLESLGYKNYWKDLNSKDYGVAQNRDRTFMISFLDAVDYHFPRQFPLDKTMKDYLENEVDGKYYLSDKLINFFLNNEQKQKQKGNGFRFNVSDGNVVAKAITTAAGHRMDDNYISCLPIKEATKKGYKEAHEGDYINLQFPESETRHGRVGKQIANTLLCNDAQGVVIYDDYNNKIKADQSVIGTLTTNIGNSAIRHGTKLIQQCNGQLRIRKLTPLECWRLMGFLDEEFHKAEEVNSNTQLYKQAGNSIVVDVLENIFKSIKEVIECD